MRRRATLIVPDRTVNQVSVPAPTPTTRTTAVDAEPASAAVDAAENAAAQEAIVSGFDAVAPSEVRTRAVARRLRRRTRRRA